MFKARIFTLYPELFPGPFNEGLFGKALKEKLWELEKVNIRDYATDKHKTVDDTPYGGGSGMLMRPDIISRAIEDNTKISEKIIYLSPRGKLFNHEIAKDLSNQKVINLLCGHFEGIDERILTTRNIEEISIGDFVLSTISISVIAPRFGDVKSSRFFIVKLSIQTYSDFSILVNF